MKRLISLILVFSLTSIIAVPVAAASQEPSYLEEMYQINFSNIDIQAEDGSLSFAFKNSLTERQRSSANDDIARLLNAIDEFPSIESHMLELMVETGGTLCAISITEVPLSWAGDHYERILANSRTATSSDPNGKGKFSMYTMIGVDNRTNPGKYVVWTCGSWSANSILGGENYPDAGDDYVLQTTPNSFSRIEDSLSVRYNNEPVNGESGNEYWRENGDASYVRYALEDDPLGIRQCSSFTLSTTSYAPLSDGEYRQINSYYIHTWKQLSLSVAISASTDKNVGLELTPSITNKSWQVYNYITFNF